MLGACVSECDAPSWRFSGSRAPRVPCDFARPRVFKFDAPLRSAGRLKGVRLDLPRAWRAVSADERGGCRGRCVLGGARRSESWARAQVRRGGVAFEVSAFQGDRRFGQCWLLVVFICFRARARGLGRCSTRRLMMQARATFMAALHLATRNGSARRRRYRRAAVTSAARALSTRRAPFGARVCVTSGRALSLSSPVRKAAWCGVSLSAAGASVLRLTLRRPSRRGCGRPRETGRDVDRGSEREAQSGRRANKLGLQSPP